MSSEACRPHKSHHALDRLLENEDYGIAHATVMSNANCSVEGKVDYLPVYFAMFMHKEQLPEKMIYELP